MPFFGFSIFSLWFFRDPVRNGCIEKNSILAASDGTIKRIEYLKSTKFLNEPAVRIVVFLSILNVHINRAPVEGVITHKQYDRGTFFPAYLKKADKNQKNHIIIKNNDISIHVIQMVGSIARRIVCNVNIGDIVPKGGRIGLIRFGSRTDVIIPLSKIENILVKEGDKIKGGYTVLAKTKLL
ncbi:MAG: phosphatidylserine decarboxylase [DPANN group archaeon]|nr:phosphatidylserine decarboxylase [DPANN group archaeon]